jgi:amino acid adenylation domain-containing protein
MNITVSEMEENGLEIAVISMVCRFPGARNVDEFWQNLRNGVESLSHFSEDELATVGIDANLLREPDFVKVRGVVEGIEIFDASFFGCNPREAELLDPQYRLFLEGAWETLEQAGYNPEAYKGLLGVYAGSANNHYLFANLVPHYGAKVLQENAQMMMANDREYLTSRIAYKLGLRGPAVTVQSACSTSLVAVHQACQGLLNGECDMALAGGVSLGIPQKAGYLYQEGGIASPDGHCRAFDAQAQGTVFGDGMGIVLLKRLSDALADGDCIEAVIKGSAINNDGSLKVSFTAPSVDGQARVIRTAQLVAGVDARSITYIEAHGTATPLGDPIEVTALTQAFHASTEECGFCALGSVKTNIGHTNTASGIAGLIKTILALKHAQLPPSLHFEKPNPQIDFASSPFYVNTDLVPWENQQGPLRAGVSSFGIGGTNAHIILEEAPPRKTERSTNGWQLLPLSAKTPSALNAMSANMLAYLSRPSDDRLTDIAYTLQEGRKHFSHRQVVLCQSRDDARRVLETHDAQNILRGKDEPHEHFNIFMFPGQGSQHPHMAQDLYQASSLFRAQVDRCAKILYPYLGIDLRKLLYPIEEGDEAEQLQQTAFAQPALFVIEYALSQLWMAWGVKPHAMIGHSIGEYVAACLSGVFSLEEALALVVERGKLMQSMPAGAMLAVPLSSAAVQPRLNDALGIAASNGPERCVVSGPEEEISVLEGHLAEQGIQCRRLHTSHAFHSAMMQPIVKPFVERVMQVHLQPPTIPYISNLSGTWITAEEAANPEYWGEHLLRGVHFYEGILTLQQESDGLFLEVGPGQSLSLLTKPLLNKTAKALVFPSLGRAQDTSSDEAFFLKTAGQLWLAGVPLDWQGMRAGERRFHIPLPTYPFERKRYWVEPREAINSEMQSSSDGVQIDEAVLDEPAQKTDLRSSEQGKVISMSGTNIVAATAEARHVKIVTMLTDIFGRLLGVDPTEIDAQATFLEMGADSLLLLQANQAIRQKLQVTVPFRLMLDEYPDIDELAAYVDSKLPADALPAEPPVAAQVTVESQAPAVQQQNGSHPTTAAENAASIPALTHSIPPQVQAAEVPLSMPTGSTEIKQLLERQLQVMSQQLEILRLSQIAETTHTSSNGALAAEVASSPPPLKAQAPAPLDVATIQTEQAASSALGFSRNIQQETYVPYKTRQKNRNYGLNEQQLTYLATFTRRYNERTRRSKQQVQEYRPVLADNKSVTNFRLPLKELLYPLAVKYARGARLWDIDGNEYVDTAMGFGALLFGHSPAFIVKTIEEQIQRGIQLGPQSPFAGKTAQLLCEITGYERATFCNSGTEAVMTALRIARAATGRPKIVMFTGSFHGSFDGILAVPREGSNGDGTAAPMAPGVPPHIVDDVLVLQFDTPASLEVIKAHAHELAAVLVEPRQSRRPDLQPIAFLRELRQLTQETGIALIFDEIVTGFRTHLRGVQGMLDIEADITTYGKALGGGIPVSAIAGKAQFMNVIDGGAWTFGDGSYPEITETFFAGTFFKHPLVMPVVWNVLNHLKEHSPQLQEELNRATDQITEELNSYFEQQEVPLLAVNFGSLFRFVFPAELKAITADIFFYHLIEKGIFLSEGRNCFISTAHTEEDRHYIVEAVKSSIVAMRSGGFFSDPNLHPPTPEDEGIKVAPHRQVAEGSVHIAPLPERASTASNTASQTNGALTTRYVPLTDAQKALWILLQAGDDAASAYNESFSLLMHGQVNLEALRTAVQALIDRHEALRTTFSAEGDYQIIVPGLSLDIPLVDLSHEDTTQQNTQFSQWLQRETARPFDLEHGPLMRVFVLKKSDSEYMLILIYHHIIVDGWSISVLLRELSELYSSFCQQRQAQLQQPAKFSEYAQWLSHQQQEPVMREAEHYWREHFASVPPGVELPLDRARPALKTFVGAQKRHVIDKALVERLKRLSAQQHCTLYVTLLSCFEVLLSRLSTQEDFIVGIPVAGQPLWEEKGNNLVGHCINLLPLHSTVHSDMTFAEQMSATKRELMDAYDRSIYPFIRLLQMLNRPRDLSRSPLFSTLFNFDRPSNSREELDFAGLQCDGVINPVEASKYDLTLELTEENGAILADFTYCTDLFDAETIERWAGHYYTLLEHIVMTPEQLVSHIPLLTEAETSALCIERNATETSYPSHLCVHHLFEEQVGRTPDAFAVEDCDRKLTYRELDEHANQVAHHLIKLGVGPGENVGICMQRSVEMLIALLGIFKAGGAFLPLDAAFPQERIAFMLQDACVTVLLTQEQLLPDLPTDGLNVVCLNSSLEAVASEEKTRPTSAVTGEHLAYIMYTSGSTGRPKGVLIPHSGIVNYLVWCAEAYGSAHGRGAPVQSSIAADAIFPSLFSPLLVGTCVTMLPESRSLQSLNDALHTKGGFSMIKITPTQLEVLNQQLPQTDAQGWVRTLVIGAEALRGNTLHYWQEHAPETILLNEYGPTETVVGCSIYHIPEGLETTGPVPIGLPIANTTFYVLDTQLQPVPIGVAGELYIGGDGVAWGYLNRAELSALAFIPDPFSSKPGARLYKTGDLVRYLPDKAANIEFLGRIDQQVKIRGYRVEPGEVEATLARHDAIEQVVVIVREDIPGAKQLVAYVIAVPGQDPQEKEIHHFAQQQLPEYMVPSAFVRLTALPLTATGKVDLRALPAPDQLRPDLERNYVAPENEMEQRIAAIWSEILHIDRVGIHDNFFELRGDSLLATQVVARIRQSIHKTFTLRNFFEAPTVAAQAVQIELASHQVQQEDDKFANLLKSVQGLSDVAIDSILSE